MEKLSTKQNFLWNSFGCLSYLGCQWLLTVIVVTASNDYSNSGVFAFVMATGIIFSAIGLFGIRPFQVSDLNRQFTSGNYIAFRIITNTVALAFCCVYTFCITGDASIITASLVYMLFKFDESFSDVIYGIYQYNERMDFIGISQIARGLISLITFSLPLYACNDLNLAITLMFAGCFCVTLLYDLPHARKFGKIRPKISLVISNQLFKTSILSMVSSMLIGLIVTSVRQIFGITQGSEALGIYAAIATPAVVIQVAVNYLYMPLLGKLAEARDEGAAAFKKAFFKLLGMLVVAVIVMVLVLSPLGILLLPKLYGPSINEHVAIFPWVLIVTGTLGFVYYLWNSLIVLRKQKVAVTISAIGFLVSFGSSFFLISTFGMNGINYSIILGSFCAVACGLMRIGLLSYNISND